jgi:hypothetical protein
MRRSLLQAKEGPRGVKLSFYLIGGHPRGRKTVNFHFEDDLQKTRLTHLLAVAESLNLLELDFGGGCWRDFCYSVTIGDSGKSSETN